jgi:hypothetical protein
MPQAGMPSNLARKVGKNADGLSNELTGSMWNRMRMTLPVCQLQKFRQSDPYAVVMESASQRAAE